MLWTNNVDVLIFERSHECLG